MKQLEQYFHFWIVLIFYSVNVPVRLSRTSLRWTKFWSASNLDEYQSKFFEQVVRRLSISHFACKRTHAIGLVNTFLTRFNKFRISNQFCYSAELYVEQKWMVLISSFEYDQSGWMCRTFMQEKKETVTSLRFKKYTEFVHWLKHFVLLMKYLFYL